MSEGFDWWLFVGIVTLGLGFWAFAYMLLRSKNDGPF